MPEGVTANVQQIIDSVEKLTVLELSELVKALEDHFGVSASAPMMMAAPGAMAGAAGGDEAAEEKTTFTPMLAEVGGEKIKVIKEVRAHTSMGLKEAKGFVEGDLPAAIKEDVSKEEAEDIKKKFEAVGAKVTIK